MTASSAVADRGTNASLSSTAKASGAAARSLRWLGTVRLLLLVAEREHELAEHLHDVDRRLAVFQLFARLQHGVRRAGQQVDEAAAEQPVAGDLRDRILR